MEHILVALFGVSVGTLISYTSIPRIRWVPNLCALTILVLSVAASITMYPDMPASVGVTFSASVLISVVVAAAQFWRKNPLMEGLGFWERLQLAINHRSTLKESQRSAADTDTELMT